MSDVSLKASVQFTPRGDLGRYVTARVTPGVVASVAAAQQLIVEEARANAPVRTGSLRASISAEDPDDSGKTVMGRIVAAAPYAGYVEFGTGIRGAGSDRPGSYPYSPTWPGMEAQPFLRPALDTTRAAVKELFASQLSLELKK